MGKIFIFLALVTVAAGHDDVLPHPGECGILNWEYYYNQKHIGAWDEFPWMGRILYKEDMTCLAVLISKQHMLANAHCFIKPNNISVHPYSVVFGEWDTANNTSTHDCDGSGKCAPASIVYQIEKFVVHPMYSATTILNDIVLIRLAKPVDYSQYVRPICLPSQELSQTDLVARDLQITGWHHNHTAIAKKTKDFSQVMGAKECQELQGKTFDADVFEKYICAYTCHVQFPSTYISGAALMAVPTVQDKPDYYYLVALYTFGEPTCPSKSPSLLIRVDKYLEWIKETIQFESLTK